jgi:tetratricopeptide (TPR) repeat protein
VAFNFTADVICCLGKAVFLTVNNRLKGVGIMTIRKLVLALFTMTAAHLLMAQMVFAAGSSSEPPAKAEVPADPEFAVGKTAIDNQQWDAAIAAFTNVTSKNPENADAFNYIGYANRQNGNYDAAFTAYERALAINPDHRGANEYIGEAYLKTDNLEMAEKHLLRLDSLCFFGCPEYTMLKRAVAEYKEKKGQS